MINSPLDAKGLAAQVRALRRGSNLSQDELATKAGLSRTYISLIERGQAANITTGALRRVYAALEYAPSQPPLNVCERIAELVKELSATRNCREVSIAITKLEEAGFWLQSMRVKE